MKKLSVAVAGAALSAVALVAPATTNAAVSAPLHADTALHGVATNRDAAPSKARISALFNRWNAAVETGNPEKVAALYARDAVLLPTLSPQIRTTHDGIVDYFEGFLARNPSGTRLRSIIKVLDRRTAIDTGLYRFTFANADGTSTSVDARYTFVYEKRAGKWWIINHHSSLLPTGD
jgi:uncharacterized protein (TIGR02246 family)